MEESLRWDCRAGGKPKPSYRWLRNGEALALEVRPVRPGHPSSVPLSLCEERCRWKTRHRGESVLTLHFTGKEGFL